MTQQSGRSGYKQDQRNGIADQVADKARELGEEALDRADEWLKPVGLSIKERPMTVLAVIGGLAFAAGAVWMLRNSRQQQSRYDQVLASLSEQVARDGEGARKLVEVIVEGATTKKSARRIALSIANSPLVKTAIAGEDANWGRVVMAVGKAGEPADRDKLSIWFGDTRVAHKGARDPGYDEGKVSAYMKSPEITLKVGLGLGKAGDRVLTCDLTKEYVAINGDYRS